MARKGTRYKYSSPLTRHNQGKRRFKKVQEGQSRSKASDLSVTWPLTREWLVEDH